MKSLHVDVYNEGMRVWMYHEVDLEEVRGEFAGYDIFSFMRFDCYTWVDDYWS